MRCRAAFHQPRALCPVPLAQLVTRSRVAVDVSISDDSGPRAARYMAQQCRAYPPLKPLVLVLKAYLKVACVRACVPCFELLGHTCS
jgi:DNA polymerase sigma